MKLRDPVKPTKRSLQVCMHAICNPPTGIFIDKIRVKAPCTHIPFGKVLEYDDENLGLILVGATAIQTSVIEGGEKAYVRSKTISPVTGLAGFIEVHCCPPLVLQKHNLFGHNDLRAYVFEILNLVTWRLGITVSREDRDEWWNGAVGITEIHLTGNFECPASAVIPIIDAVDQNKLEGKQRNIRSCITIGFTKKRRSVYHALTIYDKHLEMKGKFKKPGEYQIKLLDAARNSIRAEIKLYSQELTERGLQYVMNWKDICLTDLFFEFFTEYKITYSIQRLLTDDERAVLNSAELVAYLLWMHGEDVAQFYKSRTSTWSLGASILKKTGIDIGGARRPDNLPSIDLKEVFVEEKLIPVPQWAFGTRYYADPSTVIYNRNGIG